MINVGLEVSSANPAGQEPIYNVLAGTYGTINSIRLMDGKNELSSLRNANIWMGWKGINKNNSIQDNINSTLFLNNAGFRTDDDMTAETIRPQNIQVKDTDDETSYGWLDVKEMLPLLKSLDYLDTELFTDLKLVIEYETDKHKLANEISKTFSNSYPSLVVDLIQDDGVLSGMRQKQQRNIVYNEIEHDAVFLVNSQGAEQPPVNLRVKGFDNKMLNRILLVKENENSSNYEESVAVGGQNLVFVRRGGPIGSLCNLREKVNFQVNGKNKLVGDGLTRPNEKLGMLVDTWGDIACVYGMNLIGTDRDFTPPDWSNGMLGYIGCFIGEEIKDLQIRIGRSGQANGGNSLFYNDGQLIHCFGEVSKVLNIKGNEYNIAYV